MELHVLSGGAAKGVVTAIESSFSLTTGATLRGTFGAVGVMQENLLAGAACDVLILTAALLDRLADSGHVIPASIAPLGRVKTGIAVRSGEPLPDVATSASLKATLLAARGIYFPDPQRATAGIHFVQVLTQLGIYEQVKAQLRPYPNGAVAMQR